MYSFIHVLYRQHRTKPGINKPLSGEDSVKVQVREGKTQHNVESIVCSDPR